MRGRRSRDARLDRCRDGFCERGTRSSIRRRILRKEVIQPQVPLRLPCYDFTPITNHTLGTCLPYGLAPVTSGTADFRGVTGGVYKARERIHRGVLIRDY